MELTKLEANNTYDGLKKQFYFLKATLMLKEVEIVELQSELKKLRVTDVSICSCGSTKYYSEQYKDVTKYYCSSCHEKI